MTQGNNDRRVMRIYVDGLLPECEDQDVRQHFSQFGKVVEAFVARERDTHLSRCFATVSMQDASVSAKLMKRTDHEIWGTPVVVKITAPTVEERPETHVPPPPPIGEALNENGRFFVTGLTQDITEDDLREHFCKFGEVSDCIVAIDEGGNHVAAIRLVDPFAVPAVIEESHEVKGQKLKVDEKLEKPIIPAVSQTPAVTRTPPPPPSAPSSRPAGDRPAAVADGETEPGKFFVGGCARGTTEDELRAYFSSIGHLIELSLVKDKATGQSKGCCFITFAEHSDELRTTMLEQTHTINEQAVRIDEARKKAKGAGKGKDGFGGDRWGYEGGKGGKGGHDDQSRWNSGSDWNRNDSWRDSWSGGKSKGGGKSDDWNRGGQDWGSRGAGSWNNDDRGGSRGGWGGDSRGAWGDDRGSRRPDDRGFPAPPPKRHAPDEWRGGGGFHN